MSIDVGFDLSELDDFNQRILELADRQFPNETKKFIRRQGNAVKSDMKKAYKQETKKHTGNLLKGVDMDSYATRTEDGWQIRVRNTAPHAHLIEHGHVFYHRGQKTEKWVEGKHIVGKVILRHEQTYPKAVDEFVDQMLEKGLS